MFLIIEPKDHFLHTTFVDSFLELIHNNDILSLSYSDSAKATFIAVKDWSNGIFGGTILMKQKVGSLDLKVGKQLSTLAPKNGEVWICTVFLHEECYALSQNEAYCKSFYQNLYQKLVEFGQKEKISFLCMVLEPGEYLCTEALGYWPYVFEVRPRESLDGLFHGILSLPINPSNYHKYRDVYKEIKLAA